MTDLELILVLHSILLIAQAGTLWVQLVILRTMCVNDADERAARGE